MSLLIIIYSNYRTLINNTFGNGKLDILAILNHRSENVKIKKFRIEIKF